MSAKDVDISFLGNVQNSTEQSLEQLNLNYVSSVLSIWLDHRTSKVPSKLTYSMIF